MISTETVDTSVGQARSAVQRSAALWKQTTKSLTEEIRVYANPSPTAATH